MENNSVGAHLFHFNPDKAQLEQPSLQTLPVEILIETPRLYIRRMIREDLPWLFQLHSNPEVMRYIRIPDQSQEETAEKIEAIFQHPNWSQGHGLYPIHFKSTGEVIGWTLLNSFPETNLPETGYRLFPAWWGMGIATETTLAFVEYLHQQLHLPLIGACTHQENIASQRVLEKCGFMAKGIRNLYGRETFFFAHST